MPHSLLKDSELCSLSESTRKTGSRDSYPSSRDVSPALPKSKQNSGAAAPGNDVPAGRAGGRTAEAPRYAAEACIKQKPPLTQGLSIPSFRFAASITAFILANLSDSSDGPVLFSQSALNNSPNSMCCTTGF